MYASVVAEIPPVISSITPRSHVIRATVELVSSNTRGKKTERTKEGAKQNGGGEEEVTLGVECFMRKEILLDYLWMGQASIKHVLEVVLPLDKQIVLAVMS